MLSTVLASSWVYMYSLFKLKLSWDLTYSTSLPVLGIIPHAHRACKCDGLGEIPRSHGGRRKPTHECLCSSDLHTHTRTQLYLHKEGGRNRGVGKRIYNKIKQYSLLSHFSSNVLSLSHKFPESQWNLEFYIYLKAHTSSRVYFMSQFEFLAYIPHSQMFDISITGKQSQPLVQCYKAGLPWVQTLNANFPFIALILTVRTVCITNGCIWSTVGKKNQYLGS